MMKSLVVGLGEVGGSIYELLMGAYGKGKVKGYDPRCDKKIPDGSFDLLHICFPYSKDFVKEVTQYINEVKPAAIIIHSSVKVGTCKKILGKILYSPVRGKHPHMKEGLTTYKKYIYFDGMDFEIATQVKEYFIGADMPAKTFHDTAKGELAKLLALSRYGTYIAFAKEQERICSDFGFNYWNVVGEWEESRNAGLRELGDTKLCQPQLFPFGDYVGGHCTVEDMELLLEQYMGMEPPLLAQAYRIDKGTKIWGDCNIYPTVTIGKGCSIGNGTEVGHKVKIGNNVRIGAQCFLPEGVEIEDDAFLGPKVGVSNDKYPPSGQENWGKVLIKKGASIGMGTIILPDVTIGENALVGAGSVVTKDVPDGEKWYGSPAYSHGDKDA